MAKVGSSFSGGASPGNSLPGKSLPGNKAAPHAGDDGVPPDLVVVGRITTAHGIRGWVKIHSFTGEEDAIFGYRPWWLRMPGGWQALAIDSYRRAAKGFIAHIEGVDSRDDAARYCRREIAVSASLFPELEKGDYYWYQLQGLRVIARHGNRDVPLGTVTGFLETGANDVMVVRGDADSVDSRERLLPYIDDVLEGIDLERGEIRVIWDPDF
jgi:16S rRNA processing protein RimM